MPTAAEPDAASGGTIKDQTGERFSNEQTASNGPAARGRFTFPAAQK